MNESEKEGYYTDKETINSIIEILKKYSFNQLKKREHYYYSLMEKNTDERILKEYYSQFNRITLIRVRKRINKPQNYDIYYELDDGTGIIYAIDIEKNPPLLINAFPFSRNMKRFIEYLIKRYGKEML
ncbi:hypothetical protein HYW76_03865 [Candidatus Pacearchaeota archaeon]|nr:hypothetical protein [Candidatus Pacearchaeota archaeon]